MVGAVHDVEAIGLVSAVGALSTGLVELLLEIALLVVTLVSVRRSRPDATAPFVAASLVLFFATVAMPVGPALTMALMSTSSSAEAVLRVAIVGHVIALVRTAGLALMLAGVARLASPARANA